MELVTIGSAEKKIETTKILSYKMYFIIYFII